MSIKIQVISDIHLEFQKALPKIFKQKFTQKPQFVKAPYLFLAGDIGYPKLDRGIWLQFINFCEQYYDKIFYVSGNHEAYNSEYYETIDTIKEVFKSRPKFVYLERGVISQLGPYKVVGCTLWSDVNQPGFTSLNDGTNIKIKKNGENHNLSQQDILEFHKKDKEWLESQVDSNTIVMTHHLPSYDLINSQYIQPKYKDLNTGFASELDSILLKSKAWIYGHTHIGGIKDLYGTICICNPFGYPDDYETNFTMEPIEL
jgi:predicted phosphodiesterase